MLRKVLRNLGLALVFMPEPFTTPVGLLLLGAAYFLPRGSGVDNRRHLRGLIELYLKHTNPVSPPAKAIRHGLKRQLSAYHLPEPARAEAAIRHTVDDRRLLLRYGKVMAGAAINRSGLEMTESPRAAKTIRHSLDQRWANYDLTSQEKETNEVVQHSIERRRPVLDYYTGKVSNADKVVFHSLGQRLSGYVLPSQPVTLEKTTRHTLDSNKLQRYYEETMSGYPAARHGSDTDSAGAPQKTITHNFHKAKLISDYRKSFAFPPALAAVSSN